MSRATYPQRTPCFAIKFTRRMMHATVANDLGAQGFALLVSVVMAEDSGMYQREATYFDSQLIPLTGAGSQDTLSRVRQKVVAAGWLHYEPGKKSVPGRYWVLIPSAAHAFMDTEVDAWDEDLTADSSAPMRTNVRKEGDSTADSSAPVRTKTRGKPGASARNLRTSYTSS
jgi:hypothetical protein